jgi:transposase InsO family protein
VRNLGIAQARTPFRSPQANAIAERWVRWVRAECLDNVFIFNERHLEKVLAEYVVYFNLAPTSFDWTTCTRRVADTCRWAQEIDPRHDAVC